MKYIVNPVFPEGGVHLIGAALGVAPQRLFLPLLSESDRPTTFLGHPARSFRHFYVGLDETRLSLKRKLHGLGYSETIRAVSIDEVRPLTVKGMLIPQDTEVLLIGDIGPLVQDKFKRDDLASSVTSQLRALAKERNLTIIASTWATKKNTGRARITGSAMWSRLADTVVILDPGSQPDSLTATIMLPVNSQPEVVDVIPPLPFDAIRDDKLRLHEVFGLG